MKFLTHLGANAAGDGLQLRIRSPAAHDEKIGEIGNAAQIDDLNILRLLVGGSPGAHAGQPFRLIHLWLRGALRRLRRRLCGFLRRLAGALHGLGFTHFDTARFDG